MRICYELHPVLETKLIDQKLLTSRKISLNENVLQLSCFPLLQSASPCPKWAISQLTFTFMLKLIVQKTKMYLTTPLSANAYQ